MCMFETAGLYSLDLRTSITMLAVNIVRHLCNVSCRPVPAPANPDYLGYLCCVEVPMKLNKY